MMEVTATENIPNVLCRRCDSDQCLPVQLRVQMPRVVRRFDLSFCEIQQFGEHWLQFLCQQFFALVGWKVVGLGYPLGLFEFSLFLMNCMPNALTARFVSPSLNF